MLPAPAQGAIGIEARSDDARTIAMLAVLDHPPTHACVSAERALLAALNANCHSPVAALADSTGMIRAELFAEDGSAHVAGAGADPATLARDLLARAPDNVRRLFTA